LLEMGELGFPSNMIQQVGVKYLHISEALGFPSNMIQQVGVKYLHISEAFKE